MINIAATVKHNFFNALFESTLSNRCANFLGCLAVTSESFKTLFDRGCGNQGVPCNVIDYLGIDMILAAEYAETRLPPSLLKR